MTCTNPSDTAARMPSTPQGGFPAQEQEPPGSTARMDPVPGHGADSYRGSGRLAGLQAGYVSATVLGGTGGKPVFR